MKIDAVGVASSDIRRTVEFYSLIGFDFSEINESDPHVEAAPIDGSARLMIDTKEIIQEIIGKEPVPGNHSTIAIHFDSPSEIDEICKKIKKASFKVVKEPWDAFWGQRYAIVQDPDGYMIDLFAYL